MVRQKHLSQFECMPRNENARRGVRAWLNHLLAQPHEQQQLIAAAQEALPHETAGRSAKLSGRQRDWLINDLFLCAADGIFFLLSKIFWAVPKRGLKRGQNEVQSFTQGFLLSTCPHVRLLLFFRLDFIQG